MRIFIVTGMLMLLLGPCAQAWAATAETIAQFRTEGAQLFSQGNQASGIGHMREALVQAETLWGETDERTDEVAYDLARMLTATGSPSSVPVYERLRDNIEKRNPDDPRLAIIHYGLAVGGMKTQPEESIKEFETARRLMKAQGFDTRARKDQLYVRALYQQAYVELSQLEPGKARRHYAEAIKTSKTLFGADSVVYGEALYAQAQYYVAAGKVKKGGEEYEEALAIFRKHLPEDNLNILNIHAALVSVYERLGESSKATDHLMVLAEKTPDTEGAPKPIYRTKPQYPMQAEMTDREGGVTLHFRITTDGHVDNVSVTEGDPDSAFAKATIKAIKKWRYKPQFRNGQPIDSYGSFRMRFYMLSGDPSTRVRH